MGQLILVPDSNSGGLTGKWCLKKRFFGGYDVMVECITKHTTRIHWRRAEQVELSYLNLK